MATIPDTCEFNVIADQLRLTTQTNGDSILIKGIDLSEGNAAALARLINIVDGHKLQVKIREAP